MCRERAAEQPQKFGSKAEILGLLRGPFATKGRSHRLSAMSDYRALLIGPLSAIRPPNPNISLPNPRLLLSVHLYAIGQLPSET